MRHGIVLGVFALMVVGCSSTTNSPDNSGQVTAYAVWVVNTLGESLSKVDLDSGTVVTDDLLLDSAPNDIAISGNLAYVVNSASNNVQIFDLTTEETIGTIEIYMGLNPYFIVIQNQQRAFVSNWLTGNVSVLDLQSQTEVDTITTSGVPQGLCVSNNYLFVTDVNIDLVNFTYGPGRLLAYSLGTLDFVDSAEVGVNPQIVQFGPDGKLHVVCTGDFVSISGEIDIVNPQSLAVEQTIPIGGSPGSLTFNSSHLAYLGSGSWTGEGGLLCYDALTYGILHDAADPIPLPSSVMDVACAGNDHLFAVCFNTDELIELDESDEIIQSYTVGDGPVALAIKE